MSMRMVSKRWLGVMLLTALFSLFTVAGVQAKDARLVDIVPAVPCDFGDLDSDPWMSGAEPAAPCPGLEVPVVQSIEFFGDLALMRVVVGDKIESRVYRQVDTRWEHIYIMSADDGELDYLIELEDAYNERDQGVRFSPEPVVRSSDSTSDVEYEMTGNESFGSEIDVRSKGGMGWESIQFAPVGDAYWDYLLALESNETDH